MALALTSKAFRAGGEIPPLYTCDGKDLAPPLEWTGIPPGTKSLALIVDDPDAPDPAAPKMTWVHWLLYNIPPDSPGIPDRGVPLPKGAREGLNDWKRTSYGGPAPPIGRHRYFFKLYALDVMFVDLHKPSKEQLETAMKGHILAKYEIVGTYERKKKA